MMHFRYFDTTRNDNHCSFLTPTLVRGRCPFPYEIFTKSEPPWEKTIVLFNQYFICIQQMALPSHYSCLANSSASRPAQNHWQCRQLHNGLFRCRQSHGLSAIAQRSVIILGR